MRHSWAAILAVAGGLPQIASAQVAADAAVQAQWFTGTLEAPSPALPKAGLWAIEPYLIYQHNTGSYDNNGGRHSSLDDVRQTDSVTVFKYGITDRLSIQALPSFARVWNDQARVTGVGDLPVEFEYRFNDENDKTGFPSVTASLGTSLPLGQYDRLRSPIDGLGSGAHTAKEGILFQSLFDTWGRHPMRLRFYATAFEPIGDVSVHGTSIYGTDAGFVGHVKPGFSNTFGVGASYGLDQRWVLACGFLQNFSKGARLRGVDASGTSVDTNGKNSATTFLAPAVEYNFSSRVGAIAGVEFSIAGRNTASYVAPQIALVVVF